jgi:hypothetical protein
MYVPDYVVSKISNGIDIRSFIITIKKTPQKISEVKYM